MPWLLLAAIAGCTTHPALPLEAGVAGVYESGWELAGLGYGCNCAWRKLELRGDGSFTDTIWLDDFGGQTKGTWTSTRNPNGLVLRVEANDPRPPEMLFLVHRDQRVYAVAEGERAAFCRSVHDGWPPPTSLARFDGPSAGPIVGTDSAEFCRQP